MRRASTTANAVAKARVFRPEVRRVRGTESLWTVGASAPGEVYLLEVGTQGADCPCRGYGATGYCYHAAALEELLGLLPEEHMPTTSEPTDPRLLAPLRDDTPKGRLALFT